MTSSRRGLSGFVSEIKTAGSNLVNFLGAGLLTRFAPAAIVAGFATIGASAISLAGNLEQTKVGFEVMLGSAEQANKMIGEIRSFAKVTPFETKDLAKAAETMLGFGIAGDRVMPNLKMLGDVARGNADRLNLISLAFSQIQAAGRLTGQDLLQLVNSGFNPLQEISERTGKSLPELKKLMEDGGVSADMVTEAFRSATSQGGRFFQMMEKMSKTYAGLMSTLRDEWNEALTTLGEKLLPTVIEGLTWTRELLFDITNRVNFEPLLAVFRDTGFLLKDLIQLFGISVSQLDALQVALGAYAFAWRTATLMLRVAIVALSTWIDLIKVSINTTKGFGMMLVGVFTRDMGLIQQGWELTKNSFVDGFDDISERAKTFVDKEWEGYKKIFSGPNPLELPEGVMGPDPSSSFWVPPNANGSKASLAGGRSDKHTQKGIDKISAGGKQSVNVTINLNNLIGQQNFDVTNVKESVRDMEKQAVEALLRVLNSANYAASQ